MQTSKTPFFEIFFLIAFVLFLIFDVATFIKIVVYSVLIVADISGVWIALDKLKERGFTYKKFPWHTKYKDQKRIDIYDIKDRILVYTADSILHASMLTEVSETVINNCCKRSQANTRTDFLFRFEGDPLEKDVT